MKTNTLKQQKLNAELETIIEDFGRAMRDANKKYIAQFELTCIHGTNFVFTPHMKEVWFRYAEWCQKHG